jgi:hypothetical protein
MKFESTHPLEFEVLLLTSFACESEGEWSKMQWL